MEASQIFEGAEECHSSESGWTMYIGSPIDDDKESDKRENEGTEADPEDYQNSDDSMASDASSGPSHYGISHSFADFQRPAEEEYDENKCCLDKKASKTEEKHMEGKKVEEKEKLLFDSKGKSPVFGGGKVRKNYWALGKRK
ncbi:hypothetical protein VNO77_24432 [Canavalia gladiata]|uniref:Uncharacterized protein n=1 Tax=Canavalia gladiata TaxID=3824 RepID=A0AAN9QCQ7_CANGL